MTSKKNILLIGDCGVGKSSLTDTIYNFDFESRYLPTFGLHKCEYDHFNIYDYPGEDFYNFENHCHEINKLNICIIMYDLTNKNSFKSIDKWKTSINNKFGEIKTIYLISYCN